MRKITVKFNATGRFALKTRLEDADKRGRKLGERIQKHGIMEPVTFTEAELQHLNDIAQGMNYNQTNAWLNTKLRLRRATSTKNLVEEEGEQ